MSEPTPPQQPPQQPAPHPQQAPGAQQAWPPATPQMPGAQQPGAGQPWQQPQHPGSQQPPQAWQQPAQQQWMPPAAPMVVVPLKPTAITVMLVLESVATAFSVLLIVGIVALASSEGNPPPLRFAIAFCLVGAMMVLRVGALVLVRFRMGWARWIYVGVVAIGTIAAAVFAPVPLVFLLLVLAIVTIVQLFRRPTATWLRWRASDGAQQAAPPAQAPSASA